MAHLELVSTISLGYNSTFSRIKGLEKILVVDRVIRHHRGLAGTTKVTYNQGSAVQKARGRRR